MLRVNPPVFGSKYSIRRVIIFLLFVPNPLFWESGSIFNVVSASSTCAELSGVPKSYFLDIFDFKYFKAFSIALSTSSLEPLYLANACNAIAVTSTLVVLLSVKPKPPVFEFWNLSSSDIIFSLLHNASFGILVSFASKAISAYVSSLAPICNLLLL